MTDREKLQIVPSLVAEGVSSQSLEIASENDEKTAENKSPPDHPDGNDEKIAVPDDDDGISTISIKETKVNFGFLPIPKRCRITPTHPFKFNLTINILFGFASTFTVILHK
jgi:hypothetical protein